VVEAPLLTTNLDEPLVAKLKSSHLVAELLSIALSGVSDPGLDPPGLVAEALPPHALTALLSLNLKSAA
jgi:hypothetical protein